MEKVLTVAIIGLGSRGADSYGAIIKNDPRFKITAICDIRKNKVDRFEHEFNVSNENCFLDENDFFKKKLADVCIIATQDKDHVRHCLKALELGYDILLEKPITSDIKECYQLLDAQKTYGGKVIVCHVLRYAPVFMKLDELLDSGIIGKLVHIQAIERVGYSHQSHSYVRGNWRKKEETSPMIMAKCCHDLDLIQHYARSKMKDISSYGSLSFFKKENQPEGASDRCSLCKYKNSCPYSAYNTYLVPWKYYGCPAYLWPQSVITSVTPLTEEAILEAIENTYYGQCVFACDNNVVDNQTTNIVFENGVTANLLMTAFMKQGGRKYTFCGTYGEIDMDEVEGRISIKVYGDENDQTIKFESLGDVNGGHGGGDQGIIDDVYNSFALNKPVTTSLAESLESHIMAIEAENRRSLIDDK
jgi:predicted dehydrogenase